jgi:hypothetical protein
MRTRSALLILLLLGAVLSLGLADGVTFSPRAQPTEGAAWTASSTWHTTGHNKITVAGVSVRDKPIDHLSHYVAGVQVAEVADGKVSNLNIAMVEQVDRSSGDSKEIGLDGVSVHGLGAPGERKFTRADGARLKRPQKKWLEEQFGGNPDTDGVNPIEFLLPSGAAAPGSSWDMDLDKIAEYFDPERFKFDMESSRARVTLEEVREWHGVQAGHFSFDVYLVPSWIKDGTIRQATMHITGTADLPTDGALPWMAFDLNTDMRFDGTVKRRGIKADVDLTMTFDGKESQIPPIR